MRQSLFVFATLCLLLSSCGTAGKELVQEDMGYSISIPEDWEMSPAQEQTTWSFGTTETTYYQVDGKDIFAITQFTTGEWASVEANVGPKPTVIKENEEHVWVYDQTQDASGVEDYVDKVPVIIETFETL